MTSAVEVQQAALRIALRSKESAVELADWLIAEDGSLDDRGWNRCEIADELGFKRYSMKPAERYEVAAAALLLAAEFDRLTPFQQWFQRNHTTQERERFTERDLQMMEIGFTKHGRENT